jgi:hypothetical protein
MLRRSRPVPDAAIAIAIVEVGGRLVDSQGCTMMWTQIQEKEDNSVVQKDGFCLNVG